MKKPDSEGKGGSRGEEWRDDCKSESAEGNNHTARDRTYPTNQLQDVSLTVC